MDEDCIIVKVLSPEAEKKSESTEKGSAKKLKQTLLCFKAVDPNVAIPSITNLQPSKKRRLSEVSTFSKSTKNAKKANSGTLKRKSVGNGVDEGDKEVSSSCEMEGVQPMTEAAVPTTRPGNSSDLLMKFIHTAQQVEVSTTSSKDGELAVETAPESENENEPTSTGENRDWVSQDETSVENKENIPDSEDCQEQEMPCSSVVNPVVPSQVLSDEGFGKDANVAVDANLVTTVNDDVVDSVIVDENAARETTAEEGAGNCAILVQIADNCAVVEDNADISMTIDDLNAKHVTVNNDELKSASVDSSAEKDLSADEGGSTGAAADQCAVDVATVEEENIDIDADKIVSHSSDNTAKELQTASSSDIEKAVSVESSEMLVEEELDSDDGKSGELDLSGSSTSGEGASCKVTGSSSNHESTKSEEKIILNEEMSEKPTLKVKAKRPKVPFPSTKKQKEEQQEKELTVKKKCKEDLQHQKKERKEQRERDRQEAKMQKEKERLEKEKEKEDKKRQKEEERQKKQEQQEEEKKKKEEAKLEEKKRKEEEKKKKEEEKQDKEKVSQKEKQLMQNFFFKTAKDTNASVEQNEAVQTGPFMPFEPKKNMRLAPKSRVDSSTLTDRAADLDSLMASQSSAQLYIEGLKKNVKRGKSGKTWPSEEMSTEDVVVVEALNASMMKAKLFQFSENNRPAYYGTWQKQSQCISGRRPFAKDTNQLDYEVDSDDEWEEVEPGESLSHSEGEDEAEPDVEPEDDEDGSFMVPHGYLSEGEGCEDEDDVRASPDELKACQLAKARNWDAAINTKQRFEALRPICIGICWWTPNANTDSNRLKEYEAVLFEPQPITLPDISCCSSQDENKPFRKKHTKQNGKERKGITYIPVPEAAIPDLIRLVHGNEWSIFKVVKEFQEFWRFKSASNAISQCKVDQEVESEREHEDKDSENLTLISKRKLDAKIRQIAIYERRPSIFHKRCWYVCSESLERHGLTELHVPNQWKWMTKLPNKSRKSLGQAAHTGDIQEKPVKLNQPRPDSSALPSTAGTSCALEGEDKTELVTQESTLKMNTGDSEAEAITTSKKTVKNPGIKKHCVKRLGKKKSTINSSLIHCFITGAAGQSKMTSGNTMLKSTSSASDKLMKPKIVSDELFKNPTVLIKRLKSIAVTNPVTSVLLSSGTQLEVIQSTGRPSLQPPKRPSDGSTPEPKRQNLQEVGDDSDCIIVGVEKKLSSSVVPIPGSCTTKASMQNTSN